MRTLIIDEFPFEIVNIISANFADCEIAACTSDINEAVRLYGIINPELIIMNIRIGNQLSFKLFQYLDFNTMNIIFTSEYKEFMNEVLSYNAIDFIVKPYILSKIRSSISKAREKIGIVKPKETRPSWTINLKSLSLEHLNIDHIIKIRSSGSYSNIFMANNNMLCTSRNIGNYEKFLTGKNFIRIHNCCMINTNQIQSYSFGRVMKIIMNDHSEESVARARRNLVLKCLMQTEKI